MNPLVPSTYEIVLMVISALFVILVAFFLWKVINTWHKANVQKLEMYRNEQRFEDEETS